MVPAPALVQHERVLVGRARPAAGEVTGVLNSVPNRLNFRLTIQSVLTAERPNLFLLRELLEFQFILPALICKRQLSILLLPDPDWKAYSIGPSLFCIYST